MAIFYKKRPQTARFYYKCYFHTLFLEQMIWNRKKKKRIKLLEAPAVVQTSDTLFHNGFCISDMILLSYIKNQFLEGKGVTRLHGARSKKQVWRPHGRIWVLSKANLLYWKKYLWHCWDFSAPPAVIRRPRNDSASP